MVTLSPNKIIVEIEDSCPKNLLHEFQNSIVVILQNLDFNSGYDAKELETAHFFILKLLRELNQTTWN